LKKDPDAPKVSLVTAVFICCEISGSFIRILVIVKLAISQMDTNSAET
jgi:hypothetical protein